MSSFRLRRPTPDDAAAVAAAFSAYEAVLYGYSMYDTTDLEAEWADVDLGRDAWVAESDRRIIGYARLRERGEIWRGEAFVHPEASGRGVGTALMETVERDAGRRGGGRLQVGAFEPDESARRLLDRRGYRRVRIFREMRIELDAPPASPTWPEGLRVDAFTEDDARGFHAALEEAFADHWEHAARDFESWRNGHMGHKKYDPSLWCVVRAGDEIAAGTINIAGMYGGGYVDVLFTRRRWRRRGVGRALLQDAFVRFWERGERSVGLGVDAESEVGAFRLYERAGMTPAMGWLMYEKELPR
jgi:mycothiol synthase